MPLAPTSDRDIAVRWWIRVRWGAVVAETAALLTASSGLHLVLPWVPMLVLICAQAGSNAWLHTHRERVARSEPIRLSLLAADAAVLTVLLFLSGGPNNPFSTLYFIEVTLAGMLLGRAGTAAVWLSTVGGYGLLFVEHRVVPELSHAHHTVGQSDAGFELHLYGMFVAFAVTSGIVAYFVVRLSESSRQRSVELARAREKAARAQRVVSLTTLAAGAAHELGTPLGTIAVVAKELERSLDDPARQDAQVIRQEVDRCRLILNSMSTRAGDVIGESLALVELRELADEVQGRLPGDRRDRLDLLGTGSARVPHDALLQLLENLVNNAFDASETDARVQLSIDGQRVDVIDQGTGMDAETLARATEPFFSTKPEGSGMGLGLYLARVTAEAMGGRLELSSRPGHGTVATVYLGETA